MRVQRSLAAMVLCLMSFSTIANPSVNTLYTFNASWADGANPEAPLVQNAAGNLYGTAAKGGTSGEGTVFQLSPTGQLTTRTTLRAIAAGGGYDSSQAATASYAISTPGSPSSSGGGGGGSFDGWGLFVLGLLATRRRFARIL